MVTIKKLLTAPKVDNENDFTGLVSHYFQVQGFRDRSTGGNIFEE